MVSLRLFLPPVPPHLCSGLKSPKSGIGEGSGGKEPVHPEGGGCNGEPALLRAGFSGGNIQMIPLKKPDLRRCFNFPVTAAYAHAYAQYASFLENFAPCISGFLSGIRF